MVIDQDSAIRDRFTRIPPPPPAYTPHPAPFDADWLIGTAAASIRAAATANAFQQAT